MDLVLVDDHRLFLIGLREIIHKSKAYRVKAEFFSGSAFLESYVAAPDDLVLLDLDLDRDDGIEIISSLLGKFPKVKTAVLSMHKEREVIRKAVSLGIVGYFNKDIDNEELLFGLRKIENGGKYFTSVITEVLLTRLDDDVSRRVSELTQRELQVLQFIVDGYTSEEIAKRLKLGKRTIDSHRASILAKFNLKNTAQLIKFSVENKLL
jgi:two-component system, NarL family, response regulator NreC